MNRMMLKLQAARIGVDRDSEIVAPLFDERNQAVKSMIASVINVAKAKGKRIGICGQAPVTIRTSRSFWSSRALIASRSIPIRSSRRPWPSWR